MRDDNIIFMTLSSFFLPAFPFLLQFPPQNSKITISEGFFSAFLLSAFPFLLRFPPQNSKMTISGGFFSSFLLPAFPFLLQFPPQNSKMTISGGFFSSFLLPAFPFLLQFPPQNSKMAISGGFASALLHSSFAHPKSSSRSVYLSQRSPLTQKPPETKCSRGYPSLACARLVIGTNSPWAVPYSLCIEKESVS